MITMGRTFVSILGVASLVVALQPALADAQASQPQTKSAAVLATERCGDILQVVLQDKYQYGAASSLQTVLFTFLNDSKNNQTVNYMAAKGHLQVLGLPIKVGGSYTDAELEQWRSSTLATTSAQMSATTYQHLSSEVVSPISKAAFSEWQTCMNGRARHGALAWAELEIFDPQSNDFTVRLDFHRDLLSLRVPNLKDFSISNATCDQAFMQSLKGAQFPHSALLHCKRTDRTARTAVSVMTEPPIPVDAVLILPTP
jgi:hypothetical protein